MDQVCHWQCGVAKLRSCWSMNECTLAFCMPCKEKRLLSSADTTEEEGSSSNKMSERRSTRGNQSDIGVQFVACCPKGKCGRHTAADLVDLKETYITKGCLKATRKKDGDEGWQNVASNCWECGNEFHAPAASEGGLAPEVGTVADGRGALAPSPTAVSLKYQPH